MKIARCPVCHSDIHLDQLFEDEAGREMLGILVNLKGDMPRALVSYIALFRPEKSNLSNSRALKLINEVLAVMPASPLLAHSLSETVQAVSKKRRDNRNTAPLTNHQYLRQVYETQKPNFAHSTISYSTDEQIRRDAAEVERQKKRQDNIVYIEQMIRFKQPVEHLPQYKDWKEWKDEQEKLNA